MQTSILVGFLVGYGSLCLSILIDSGWALHAITAFFNFSAMLIIFGGVTGAIVISFPVGHLKEIPVALKKSFMQYKDIDLVELAIQMAGFSQKARQEGLLSLEAEIPNVQDAWLRRGLQMVVDGLDRKMVIDVLDLELEEYTHHQGIGAKIFQQLGGFAPTLGIIGTVMGLVHMLASMEDASKLGGAIAVAFLATFWGILTANLIFLPIAERTKVKDYELIATRRAMCEGLLSLQSGESVRIMEEKMKVFMNHDQRERFQADRGKAA